MMKVSKWKHTKNLEVVLYVSLFIGGLIFSWETIQEYLDGSTSYSLTKEPITLHDMPTLALCWDRLDERDVMYMESISI